MAMGLEQNSFSFCSWRTTGPILVLALKDISENKEQKSSRIPEKPIFFLLSGPSFNNAETQFHSKSRKCWFHSHPSIWVGKWDLIYEGKMLKDRKFTTNNSAQGLVIKQFQSNICSGCFLWRKMSCLWKLKSIIYSQQLQTTPLQLNIFNSAI